MNKKSHILFFLIMSFFGLCTSSFGMLEEGGTHQYMSKPCSVQKENIAMQDLTLHSKSMSKSEEVNYDQKLAVVHGKNLSSFSLSEEMYNFIISKVGSENKRPFVFKAGPQIIFVDEVDLRR